MDKFVRVSDVVDWFRAYGHMDQEIPFETLVTDLRDNSIPAADVAPVVHGKWGRVNEDRYRCDRCEQITTVDECMGKPNYNFCPNCGASMTDEAVDMVMERLEAVYGQASD